MAEMAHVDIGRKLMEQFKADLSEMSKPEREPKLEGKRMIMILTPKGHQAPETKKAEPAAAAPAVAPAAVPAAK